jgi:S1-C subfamily serine protease
VPLVTTAITRADGSFELAGIAPGRRSVTAGAYGHDMAIVGPLDIPDGGRVGPIAIELSPIAPGETPKLELAGIGAALSAQGNDLVVQNTIPGGGAEAAGILAGDLVLAVDGTPVTALGLDGAIQHIRGPVGTRVVLKIRRATATSDYTVTRTKIRT